MGGGHFPFHPVFPNRRFSVVVADQIIVAITPQSHPLQLEYTRVRREMEDYKSRSQQSYNMVYLARSLQ
jgi:hypothetical protein